MDEQERQAVQRTLERQRERLLRHIDATEAELHAIAAEREAELEERAQEDRLARLDDREVRAFQEIDAALDRLGAGTYGICEDCRRPIPVARLRVLPATRRCLDCARRAEEPSPLEEVVPRAGRLHADVSLVTDAELEQLIRDLVRDDGRVDMEELRLVCRHGVVVLDGVLPSVEQHSILRQLLTDVAGIEEVVDRLRVQELLWEREDRSKPEAGEGAAPAGESPASDVTEDVVTSLEEGLDFVPPLEPPPEER
jgi:DnaK suppressor protein